MVPCYELNTIAENAVTGRIFIAAAVFFKMYENRSGLVAVPYDPFISTSRNSGREKVAHLLQLS
jgi:hypothetical protein